MPQAFTVDLDHLDRIVTRLSNLEKSIEQHLADLDKRIQQIHTVWSGDAAASQLAAHREWMTGAAEMRVGLAALRAAALTAHENYSAAVAANTKMWW